MTMSNYPGGFLNGVTIRGVPIQQLHPGRVFWVNGSSVLGEGAVAGSDSGNGTYTHPFATIDYAIGRCTASRGDIIAVMPGHTEDIAAAAGIALDVAGIAIVGLGAASLRPKITFSATGSTFTVTAANCSISNIWLDAQVAQCVTGLSLSGAADGFSMENCLSTENANDGTHNFIDVVTLATGANDLSFRNCTFIGNDAANDAFITGVAHDQFYVDNCRFYANVAQTAAHGLIVTSGNATNVEIKDCSFRSNIDGALWVDFNGAANSGVVKNCVVSSIDTAGATSTGDFTGGHFFECYVSGEADAFGLVGGGGVVYNNA
jgi:hypothetical protein